MFKNKIKILKKKDTEVENKYNQVVQEKEVSK